jgi:hypothetical protein
MQGKTQGHQLMLRLLLAGAVAFAMGATAENAEAANPDKVFRGQVITSKKRLPTSAKSKNAYVKKLRKAKTTKFIENKKTKSWKIYFAAFFRKPLNDLEVTVKLYDVTTGRRHLVNSFEQYTEGRGQKTLISSIKLEREYFGVNKKIMIVMESRKSVLAQGTFYIIGEAEKRSGSVDFTND